VKRWLKRIGIGAGGVVLLVVVFALEEHVRGRLALNRHLNRLKANGEVYEVAALEPRHPAVEENAFTDLVNFAGLWEPDVKHLDDAPPELRFAAPDKEIVAWRLNQWGRNTKITNDWSRLGPELEAAQEFLELVHAAVQKPGYDSGFDYGKGFVDYRIGPLAKVKRNAPLLQAAAYYEMHRGHIEAAGGQLCALVKLAAEQQPEPLVICQLVRQACAGIAFDATWQGLQARGWSDSQLAAWQAAWEGCDFAKDVGSAMAMERALNLDFYEQVKSSKVKLAFAVDQRESAAEIAGGAFGSLSSHGFVLRYLHLPLWRVAWADQDELFSLNDWKISIQREKIARTNSWAALSSQSKAGEALVPLSLLSNENQMGWYDRLRFLFSSEGFSINDAVIRKAICAQVQQQMAVTAIAIYRYRLQTGKAPADLAALVPKFLSVLPRDGMDGKILRYRVKADGGFVLYSVGLDGKDDGGDSTLVTGKMSYRQIWDGRDAVWPEAATEEEALAAMKGAKD